MTGAATVRALTGADIFDGAVLHRDAALLLRAGTVEAIVARPAIPQGTPTETLGGGTLAPGYVDLQVNGGGGVMFNDAPTLATLRTMAEAHARLGATAILPTLITDTPEITACAIEAVAEAVGAGIAGIAGLHLEGPHLSLARKGAHDAALIRTMSRPDLEALLAAAERLPVLKVTVAPESVSPDQVRALADAGVLVSIGHSDAGFAECKRLSEAGARCVTHLFNAQSQLGNREPGVVGAAIGLGALSAGLIADGIHVHPASMTLALRAKMAPGQIFLVSDAMATASSDLESFTLNGREIRREDNRLTLADGTLAGAHLDLTTAIRNIVELCGVPLEAALAMATSVPADLVGHGDTLGTLRPGATADAVHLSADLELVSVYRRGER